MHTYCYLDRICLKIAYFEVARVMEAEVEAGVVACWDCYHWGSGSVRELGQLSRANPDPEGDLSEITSMYS